VLVLILCSGLWVNRARGWRSPPPPPGPHHSPVLFPQILLILHSQNSRKASFVSLDIPAGKPVGF
jgi:hypothetical protein